QRLELNEGREISLVPGLERLRAEVFETLDYHTVVVLDSHWHTTVEFVVAAQATRAGLFTSDELPRGMCRIPYDWRGDPELAHAVWSLRELRAHEASDTGHIRTAEARAADTDRIAWLEAGDHARVIDTMPEFLAFRPEARFAHYLMMIAALGEGPVIAPGRPFSDYENSVGTGQMHIWFDRPAAGWCAPGAMGRPARAGQGPGSRPTR